MNFPQEKNEDKDVDICKELSIIKHDTLGRLYKYPTYCQVLDSGDSKIPKSSTKDISLESSE